MVRTSLRGASAGILAQTRGTLFLDAALQRGFWLASRETHSFYPVLKLTPAVPLPGTRQKIGYATAPSRRKKNLLCNPLSDFGSPMAQTCADSAMARCV